MDVAHLAGPVEYHGVGHALHLVELTDFAVNIEEYRERDRYRGKGVTLVGVNVEPNSAAAIDWLKATPVTFPILFDVDSKVSKLYQVEGMPNTVILDRTGKVRYIHRGYSAGAENEYLDQIRALIRE